MPGDIPLDPLADPRKADEFLAKGKDLKEKGYFDMALTEFRRAALANPQLFEAWMEIGSLCKAKANSDTMFLRYSFEAYQKASRINPRSQDAHDQYITVAQKMGRLDEINEEYRALSKKFPDDPVIQRCFKNTTHLLMAMMPDKIDFGQTENTKKIRALVMAASIGLILFGLGFAFLSPIIFTKILKAKLSPEQINQMLKVGVGMIVSGLAGIIIKSRI